MKAEDIRKMSPIGSPLREPDEGDYKAFQCAMLQEIAAQLAELNHNVSLSGVCVVTGNYPLDVRVNGGQ